MEGIQYRRVDSQSSSLTVMMKGRKERVVKVVVKKKEDVNKSLETKSQDILVNQAEVEKNDLLGGNDVIIKVTRVPSNS